MAEAIKEAFLLAAGLGMRMRPLTLTRPKPLIDVAGKALIDHALDAIAAGGAEQAVVNVHYLADQIERHVAMRDKPRITISDERDLLLDSGGGVKKGLSHLSGTAIFVLNADSFWVDGAGSNLAALAHHFDPETMDCLLLLAEKDRAVGFEGPGDFFRQEDGRLARRASAPSAPYVYAGAMIIRTDLFTGIDEEVFSLNRLFDAAIAAGRLHGQVLDGLWLHVGTPEAIGEAEAAIAREAAA